MKKAVLLLLPILFFPGVFTPARAQEKVKPYLSVDLVSSYVWRGMRLGKAAVQPEFGLEWRGLEFSVWGNAGLVEHLGELDLTLSYTIGGLTLSIVDYWDDTSGMRYFYYKPQDTAHVFEGAVAYDFGPVAVSWQTLFAGNDFQAQSGKRSFSSYFEVSAPFRLATLDWVAAAGVVPWASDYYYTKGFGLTNLSLKASKDIPVTEKFSLPIFADLIANTVSGNLYFVAGITIKAF
ncbi:MAG: hypothetical protein II824_04835 [Bacteroidales bacterium]|nr:hypothetical protein [Bacteroidales bacterium]